MTMQSLNSEDFYFLSPESLTGELKRNQEVCIAKKYKRAVIRDRQAVTLLNVFLKQFFFLCNYSMVSYFLCGKGQAL